MTGVTRTGKPSRRGFLKGLGAAFAGAAAAPLASLERFAKPVLDLLPYRGRQAFDASAFYCPYIPLQVTSVVRDEQKHVEATNILLRTILNERGLPVNIDFVTRYDIVNENGISS